jgi:chlorite dismutase
MTSFIDERYNVPQTEETENEFYSDKVKECLDNYQKSEFEQEAWEMLTNSVDTMQTVIQKQLDELQLIQDQLKQSSRTNTFAINKIQGIKNNLKKLIV